MTKQAVGIIGAMEPEVELLKNAMFINKEEQIAHAKAYIGRLEGQDIVLVQSGIGKVNASIITALLLERYDIKCVINTGVAGAMGENLKVTDMVVSEEVVHHDVDATTSSDTTISVTFKFSPIAPATPVLITHLIS